MKFIDKPIIDIDRSRHVTCGTIADCYSVFSLWVEPELVEECGNTIYSARGNSSFIGYQPQPPLQAVYGALGLIILLMSYFPHLISD